MLDTKLNVIFSGMDGNGIIHVKIKHKRNEEKKTSTLCTYKTTLLV